MPRVVSALGKWVVHSRGARLARQFDRQTADCHRTQQQTLQRLLSLNAGTRFQHDRGISPGLSVDGFRRQLPLTTYADIAPYVDAARVGDTEALCGRGNRPLMFALTSGTTGNTKYIPVTSAFVKDYRRGWMVWAYHAFEAYPRASEHRFFQVISDHNRFRTACELPCGNISGLVQAMQTPFVRAKFVIPPATTRVVDPASKRYLTLRLSLMNENVSLISTANPSTLVQLAQQADAEQESLLRDIHDGTLADHCELPDDVRSALRRQLARKNPARSRQLSQQAESAGRLRPCDYWPHAALIAVWTGGSAGAYLPAVRDWYGEIPIRDHGLSASEGRMTIPVDDETSAGLLDVGSHFFEFIPEADIDQPSPTTLLAHELVEGEAYFVVLTTASGLYRYNIFDVVRCSGFVGTTPLLEFLHKGAHISSVTGEKLTESQVVSAVRLATDEVGCRLGMFTVCPVWGDPPGYRLLIEAGDLPANAADDKLVAALEQSLQRLNSEYREKRESGRLAPLSVQPLPAGTWSRYITRQQSRPGASIEQYKHPCLKPDLEFYDEVLSFADCRKAHDNVATRSGAG